MESNPNIQCEQLDIDYSSSDEETSQQKPLFPTVNLLYLREHITNLSKQVEGEHYNGFDEEFEVFQNLLHQPKFPKLTISINNIQKSIEYESSKNWNSEDYTSSNSDYNRFKNRYANVLPSKLLQVDFKASNSHFR